MPFFIPGPAGAAGANGTASLPFFDEGNAAGTATAVNVTGSGGTVTVTSGTAIVNITGSSSAGTAFRHVRSAGDYSTTSATFTDVDAANFAGTVTTGATRCLVGFVGSGYGNSATGGIAVTISIDGTDQGDADFGLVVINQHSTASDQNNLSFTYLTDTLSAASHAFKLRYRVVNAGTAFISGADPNAVFWVQEMA